MVTEFQIMRAHSVEPLSTFMDFITIEYMIDNVMLLLKGTLR
jgi:V-type H+-transporting ATPase subunit d